MRRDPEKTYEKILEVSSKLFFEKGYENTSLQDIVNNLDGLTKGAVYHHFSSKDDILDAIEDKLLVENNPFKKVLVYSELTGIELIKKAFLLGIEDQEQQYYNKISMRTWRQSEKIQSPKMIAKMIEINKNILAPDLCKIVEKGIKDGSVNTEYPKEISEQILVQINIGLLLSISDITEKELTRKIDFISEWTKNMGVDFTWKVAGQLDPLMKKAVENKEHLKFSDCNIEILGYVTAEQLAKILTDSSIYVHTAYIENSPNSICEAQVLGLPIISTHVGGIATLVEDKKGGLLIPANEPWQMANAIVELFEDKARMQSYSKYNMDQARKRHSVDNVKQELLACYKDIIKRNV